MKYKPPEDLCGALRRIYGNTEALRIATHLAATTCDEELRERWKRCRDTLASSTMELDQHHTEDNRQ